MGERGSTCFESTVKSKDSDEQDRIKRLVEGLEVDGDLGDSRDHPPEWLDTELFQHAQQFFRKNFFAIVFCHVMSLMLTFSFPRILGPLVYTGKSSTTISSMKRYLSTLLHVRMWYEGDIFDKNSKASQSISQVRSLHRVIAKELKQNGERESRMNVVKPDGPLATIVRRDMEITCPVMKQEYRQSENFPTVYINQLDMALTQFAFVGLLLLKPKHFGLYGVTKRDLESLAHFWRVIGWRLGVEDKFNLCTGTLEETQRACQDVLDRIVKPQLRQVNKTYEHMSRALFNGVRMYVPLVYYESMLLFLGDAIDLSLNYFYAALHGYHILCYWIMKFVFRTVLQLPGAMAFMNVLLDLSLFLLLDTPKMLHGFWPPIKVSRPI